MWYMFWGSVAARLAGNEVRMQISGSQLCGRVTREGAAHIESMYTNSGDYHYSQNHEQIKKGCEKFITIALQQENAEMFYEQTEKKRGMGRSGKPTSKHGRCVAGGVRGFEGGVWNTRRLDRVQRRRVGTPASLAIHIVAHYHLSNKQGRHHLFTLQSHYSIHIIIISIITGATWVDYASRDNRCALGATFAIPEPSASWIMSPIVPRNESSACVIRPLPSTFSFPSNPLIASVLRRFSRTSQKIQV